MRAAARLQAAIEILDEVIAATRDGGAAADALFARAMRTRRYAGSADRAAIRELVFSAIRAFGDRPGSGRAAILGLARGPRPDLLPLFDGSPRGPAPVAPGEPAASPSTVPRWLAPRIAASLGADWAGEAEALLARAPVDIRVNRLKGSAADLLPLLPVPALPVGGLPLPLPDALRLARAIPLEAHPAFREGRFELQDAASQFVAEACAAQQGETVVDLCAGAGGKTLALAAAMAGHGRIVACDTDRRRLGALGPRAARAGALAMIETRRLDPGREAAALADLAGAADLVLVDAPCSGSGTWRRNPELRWRLTPKRLAALVRGQARLLGLAAGLVRPGGRIVYAVCSVLAEEGEAQAARALDSPAFRRRGAALEQAWLLTPRRHACDGFFVAFFRARC